MSNFPRKQESSSEWVELPEVITPSHIEFVGEATGPDEDKFKDRTRRLFAAQTTQIFRRMYLARVSFGEPSALSVVVCVRHVDTIEQTLQRGFKHMFSEIQRSGKFYDWMTLAEEQEQELRKVCKPFYELA